MSSVSATVDVYKDIVASKSFCSNEWLFDDFTKCFEWYVVFYVTFVDDNFAISRNETYTSY